MLINAEFFVTIPLAALLLNAFLFFACLSAKKDKIVISFLILLLSLILWTGGSFLMRYGGSQGVQFWCDVSLTGIFVMPAAFFMFIYYYTNYHSVFLISAIHSLWAVVVVLNLFHVILQDPVVKSVNNGRIFEGHYTSWVIFPILMAVFTVGAVIVMIYRSIIKNGVSIKKYTPMLVGLLVLFLGTLIVVIPGMQSVPVDTLACAANAVLLYYALYKNRTISLMRNDTESPAFLIASIFTVIILYISSSWLDKVYSRYFADHMEQKTIALIIVCSVLAILVFTGLRIVINNIFVRNREMKENQLKELSQAITKTLDLEELLNIYKRFILSDFNVGKMVIFIKNSDGYRLYNDSGMSSSKNVISIRDDSPLVTWLRLNKTSVSYEGFRRTNSYRAMWESEKKQLTEFGVEMVLPITNDDYLSGFVMVAGHPTKKTYSTVDIGYIEAATSIISIAIKNASLYAQMQDEARRDSLTNLHNRRYFIQKIRGEIEAAGWSAMTLTLISFDDFRLYNELYGAYEGDRILKEFSDILLDAVGDNDTVARFGGKEFIMALPFYNPARTIKLLDKIRSQLEERLASIAEHGKRSLTFSAGICEYPAAGSLDELLTYANMAVYTAKRSGKNRVEIYSAGKYDEADRLRMDTEYKKIIAENCEPTILALTAAIDAKDHYTFNHSNNVSEYASKLAENISLDSAHIEIVRQAGLMHDIGKIGIPDSILSKKSELNDEEYEIMKQHVDGAIDMIRHIPSLDYVIPTAVGHHERWDGNGYPRGLKGDEIPIGARCLCIADSFDAMTTKRSYRESMTVEQALNEIELGLGKQYDPGLGRVFIDMVRSGAIKVNNIG